MLPGGLVGVGVTVVVLVTQAARGLLVHNDGGMRMHLQRGRRAERTHTALHRFGHSLGLARTEGKQHQVAGFENRADTLRDAMRRHLVDVVVKESGVIDARLLNQRFDARAGSKRRSRLIEATCPSVPMPRICTSMPPASSIALS